MFMTLASGDNTIPKVFDQIHYNIKNNLPICLHWWQHNGNETNRNNMTEETVRRLNRNQLSGWAEYTQNTLDGHLNYGTLFTIEISVCLN